MKSMQLSSFVSGGIARSNPIENTPEFEAALSGQRFIPDTWGGYATRLMDHLDLEPHEAINMLGLTQDQMADPDLQFTPNAYYNNPESFFMRRFADEARDELAVEERRLHKIVDLIASGWKVEDKEVAEAEAEKLQEKIDEISGRDDSMLLCAERDALYDGIVVNAAEFVATMLGANVLSEHSPSEMAVEWVQGVGEAVDSVVRDYVIDEETRLSDVMLGRGAITMMKNFIDGHSRGYTIAQERWEEIAPVFVARPLEEFGLIAGTEK